MEPHFNAAGIPFLQGGEDVKQRALSWKARLESATTESIIRLIEVLSGNAALASGGWMDLTEQVARALAEREGVKFHALPINFQGGTNIHFMDGMDDLHMRHEFKGKSTLDLILEGKRTATTCTATARQGKPPVDEGDVVLIYDGLGQCAVVRVTKAPYRLPLGRNTSDRARLSDHWSRLEGWSPEMYKRYVRPDQAAWQFQYERLKSSPV
jgi:hypothetical protein